MKMFLFGKNGLLTFSLLIIAGIQLLTPKTSAAYLDWNGGYRFELNEVDKTTLTNTKGRKSYLLNHLHLSPKLIAADGIQVISRFEVLPSDEYPDSQMGQRFGVGVTKSGASSSSEDSNVLSGTQKHSQFSVSQLYLSIAQEYGNIIVGRAPKHFGLGITYNAGTGPFDHWASVEDQVGIKFHIGNAFFMPIVGKVYDSSAGQGADISDLIYHLEYSNPETGSSAGVYHHTRTGSILVNDGPVANLVSGGGTIASGFSNQNVNVMLFKEFTNFNFRLEAGFQNGTTGIIAANGEEVNLNGYGVASEFNIFKPEDKWSYKVRAGAASGDDPTTTAYEGYAFHRNYDIAMLLFNHKLGQADFFGTSVTRNTSRDISDSMDDESISNAFYFSPQFIYKYSDKVDLKNTLTTATILAQPISGVTVEKAVGFEYDLDIVYRVQDKIQWINSIGVLLPGAMWQGGSLAYDNNFTFGVQSRAAISF